jgi:hypothetical protein
MSWPDFLADARQYSAALDGQTKQYAISIECFGPLDPCYNEMGVRGVVENLLFPSIKKLVIGLGFL